jgi:hypothetical protein
VTNTAGLVKSKGTELAEHPHRFEQALAVKEYVPTGIESMLSLNPYVVSRGMLLAGIEAGRPLTT